MLPTTGKEADNAHFQGLLLLVPLDAESRSYQTSTILLENELPWLLTGCRTLDGIHHLIHTGSVYEQSVFGKLVITRTNHFHIASDKH